MRSRFVALALLCCIAPASAAAQSAILAPSTQTRPAPAGAVWAHGVSVDVAALAAAAADSREVVLHLSPGLSVTTTPERVAWRGARRFTWFGSVEGGGRATLTVEGARVYGRIVTPGRAVMLEPSGDEHVVYMPPYEEGDHDDALPAPPGPARAHGGEDVLFPDEIHIALFYTSQVADTLGAGVGVFMQATVDQLTDVLANSNVAASARLVHTSEVVHTETEQLSGNLSDLQDPDDGDMDEVHDIRDAVSADMVALLVETGTNSATGCGVAYLMTSLDPSFESAAFSVTKRRCAPELVFSHEVGHNLGLHHDTYVAPGPGLFNYSHGFVNIDSMNVPPGRPGFRTPLAYHSRCTDAGGDCPRIPYYSNPELLFDGQAMGDAATADNARTVRQSIPLAATFRAPILLASNDGSTAGAPTWHRPECNDPSDLGSCAPSGTATAVAYGAWPFHVTRAGRHYVRSAASFEGVLLLYAGTFDPSSPLTGLLGYAEVDPDAPDARRLLLPADLEDGAPYVLVVTGATNGDSGVFSNAVFGPVGGGVVVGAESEPMTRALTLSAPAPNPTGGPAMLVVTSGRAQRLLAEVFDALGRRVALLFDGQVATGSVIPLTVDGGGLAPGVYVVRVTGQDGAVSRRFTVSP